MDKIELSNGTFVNCRALTKEQYDTLLKTSTGSALTCFKERYNIEVNELDNQCAVVSDNGYYTLYNSLDDLNKVLKDAFENGYQGKEVLFNKNPYKDRLPLYTDTLIEELTNVLEIKMPEHNELLIKEVDIRLNQMADKKLFERKYFINFIALIGEALINKFSGKWEMRLTSDNVTWNPYVIIKGQRVQFFVYLYEDIFMNNIAKKAVLEEIYSTAEGIIKCNLK